MNYKTHRGASWEKWKELIQKKFNTENWRIKQLNLLEEDKFSYSNTNTLEFLLTMYSRIQAVYPGSNEEDKISHMLMMFPAELLAVIKNSISDVYDISYFISTCE